MSLLEPGSTISHYRIGELLGCGGMGEVYKAVDLQLGRAVALKTLSPGLASNPIARQRLLREARSASVLSHPGICTVYEAGQEGGIVFIAMQYVEGENLQDLIARCALETADALSHALDIVDALEEAHSHGVVHRDVKPSNVIVNRRGRAVMLDFGLAKQFAVRETRPDEAPTQMRLTSETTVVGTPAYMSPEQVLGKRLDARSDIFSFGALLYEMLTGTSPFERAQLPPFGHAILSHEPPPVSQLNPRLGRDLDRIVQKCLAKEREARYQTMGELKPDLANMIGRYAAAAASTAEGGDGGRTRSGALARTASVAATATRRITETVSHLLSTLTWRAAALALATAAAGATILWLAARPRNSSDAAPASSLKYVQLLNWKDRGGVFEDTHGVLSPDGMIVAYRSEVGGRSSIRTKQTSGGDPRSVVEDEWNNWSPLWSPDGQQIAFVSTRGNRLGVWRTPAFGGTPTLVARLEGPDAQGARLRRWSKDGRTIYYQTDKNLFSLAVAGGTVSQVTRLDPDSVATRLFSLSPGEDRVSYADGIGDRYDLWAVPAAGGDAVRLTDDAEEDSYPVWHPDGERVIYSSKRDGVFQVCVAHLDGRKPAQLTFGENDAFVSDVSADGTKILYSGSREESDVWAVDAGSGQETQITSDAGAELWADASPDGKAVAFQSVRQLSQGSNIRKSLLVVRSLGAGERHINLAADAMAPRWSPDGQKIAFLQASTSGHVSVWAVDAVGGEARQLADRGVAGFGFYTLPYHRLNTSDYSWSPDGSAISYCSGGPQSGLWVSSVAGGELLIAKPPDTSTQLSSPLWSPDGARIAYVSRTEGERVSWSVSAVDVKSRETMTLYRAGSTLRLIGWSPNGALVVAVFGGRRGHSGTPAEIKVFQISAGGEARSGVVVESAHLYSMRLSPDGSRVAFVSRRDDKDNVWSAPAGGGEAKQLTRNPDPRLYFSALTWSPDAKTIYFDKQSRHSFIYVLTNFR